MPQKDYANTFQSPTVADHYDHVEYGTSSYASLIWDLQKGVIRKWLELQRSERGGLKVLDFACGTGRILSEYEGLADQIDGIDISEAMATLARQKVTRARVHVGDILKQPALLDEQYDAVTMFRFLLNTEPAMRQAVLEALRKKIVDRNGILVCNVHGNRNSLRHFGVTRRRRTLREEHHEMSHQETIGLLRQKGFEVVEWRGFGYLFPSLYRTPLRGIARLIDKSLAHVPAKWLERFSIDLLYLCRPARVR